MRFEQPRTRGGHGEALELPELMQESLPRVLSRTHAQGQALLCRWLTLLCRSVSRTHEQLELLTPYYVSNKEWIGSEYPGIWTPLSSTQVPGLFSTCLQPKQDWGGGRHNSCPYIWIAGLVDPLICEQQKMDWIWLPWNLDSPFIYPNQWTFQRMLTAKTRWSSLHC